jgi:hypothetical protein
VKTCAISGTRSGYKHRSIKNYTQSGYTSKLVTPAQLYFTLSIGQSNGNQMLGNAYFLSIADKKAAFLLVQNHGLSLLYAQQAY